ncbi:MAG: hypothetical protein K2H53_06015 [Clostridia bacterium]|nr:hypothetical protein [Clostridia bacterium]
MEDLMLKKSKEELYINEEIYQEIKRLLNKKDDYFTFEEFIKLSKLK